MPPPPPDPSRRRASTGKPKGDRGAGTGKPPARRGGTGGSGQRGSGVGHRSDRTADGERPGRPGAGAGRGGRTGSDRSGKGASGGYQGDRAGSDRPRPSAGTGRGSGGDRSGGAGGGYRSGGTPGRPSSAGAARGGYRGERAVGGDRTGRPSAGAARGGYRGERSGGDRPRPSAGTGRGYGGDRSSRGTGAGSRGNRTGGDTSGRPVARSDRDRSSYGGDRSTRSAGGGSRGERDRPSTSGRRAAPTDRGGFKAGPRPVPERNTEEERAPKQWGSLARKGTRQLKEEGAGPASLAWREAVARSRTADGAAEAPEQWEPEVWVRDEDDVDARPRRKPPRATPRAAAQPPPKATPGEGTNRKKAKKLPGEVNTELAGTVAPTKVARLQERLADAAGAYERDRYRDAARMLKPLAEMAPGAAAVRELYGLTQYRLGNWNAAIQELEAFRALSGSHDQHPTLADAYRAKKRWRAADELWEELRKASPGPELVAEGRIVHAGTLADRGRIAEAIELLEKARTEVRRPRPHHLRTWYALADLYERAGEVPRARELFRRVLAFDADLYDTAERLAAIG